MLPWACPLLLHSRVTLGMSLSPRSIHSSGCFNKNHRLFKITPPFLQMNSKTSVFNLSLEKYLKNPPYRSPWSKMPRGCGDGTGMSLKTKTNVTFGSTDPLPVGDTSLGSPTRATHFYGGAHSSPYYRNNLINLEKCN